MMTLQETLLWGLLVFGTRVTDVTIGTIRTLSIVHGRSVTAFCLGFVEVTMWISVMSILIPKVQQQPWLILFYSLGFSFGNVLGIFIERRLAIGNAVLQLFARNEATLIVESIRNAGFPATVIHGKGREGEVSVILCMGPRKQVIPILKIAQAIDPEIFYVTASTGSVRRLRGALPVEPTGWRAIFKRK
jgi:uncharacterized protein YebE (UPF0316 family)